MNSAPATAVAGAEDVMARSLYEAETPPTRKHWEDLRGDFQTRMQGYATALQNGHLNIDEVRDLEDRNPLANGAGKHYHIQLNMQSLGGDGQPATFRQKREGLDEVVEGQARRIEYDTVTETVRFIDQAQVRVLRARRVPRLAAVRFDLRHQVVRRHALSVLRCDACAQVQVDPLQQVIGVAFAQAVDDGEAG